MPGSGQYDYDNRLFSTSLLNDYFPNLTQSAPLSHYLCGKALALGCAVYALRSLYRLPPVCRADSNISRALLHLFLARTFCPNSRFLEPAPGQAMDDEQRWCAISCAEPRQPLSLEHVQRSRASAKYHLSHVFSARLHANFRNNNSRPAAGLRPTTCWLRPNFEHAGSEQPISFRQPADVQPLMCFRNGSGRRRPVIAKAAPAPVGHTWDEQRRKAHVPVRLVKSHGWEVFSGLFLRLACARPANNYCE